MIDLSIIIVNWNTKKFLSHCLTSIYRYPPDYSFEVIVVDNASSDSSQEMMKTYFPEVILVENPYNMGFAVANNLGVQHSHGRYILFINSDSLVHPGTLTGAVYFMDSNSKAGLMGCKTLNADGTHQPSVFSFPSLIRMFAVILGINRFLKLSKLRDYSKNKIQGYVQGSFILTRRNIFNEVGGFDKKLFMYAEDVDLCHRIKLAGWDLFYYPEIFITHIGGGSVKDSKQALENFIKSLLYLYQKHKSLVEFNILKMAMGIAVLFRSIGAILSPLSRFEPIHRNTIEFYRTLIYTIIRH